MGTNIDVRFIGSQDLESFVNEKEASQTHLSMCFLGGGQGGGKIAAEFSLLNYKTIFYNSCTEDLNNVIKVLDGRTKKDDYKVIRLNGKDKETSYDGTAKDRELGKQVVRESILQLQEKLLPDDNIKDSDFVWIVVALGGGTGNGSIETIAQIVSAIMRKHKRYGTKQDKDGTIIHNGKPTVGIIAAIPEDDAMHKIKLNAAQALDYIKALQEKGIVGSTLLVDNQKLIDDFLSQSDEDVVGKDWTTYGNTKVAQLVTELSILTSLDGKEVLDKSEMLDIWSTPGFLSIGKSKLSEEWLTENDNENIQDSIDEIVNQSFTKDNVFADGYQFEKALHAGMIILKPLNDKVINSKHSLMFKKSLNNIMAKSLAKLVHYGVLGTKSYGTLKNVSTKEEAIIYTMIVTKELPKRIRKMTEKALEEYKETNKKIEDYAKNATNLLDYNFASEEISNFRNDEVGMLDLESIMNDSLFETKIVGNSPSIALDDELSKLESIL